MTNLLKKLRKKSKIKLPKIIVILGPTASGKSELAVKISRKFNGEIISADSRQVYKGLDIGSGKVPKDKVSSAKCQVPSVYYYKGIPHHLLDIASPKRTFTVSQYQKLAKKALADIIKRNKLPIICGGTGLYIDALIYDYQLPAVPPQPKLRKKLEKKSTEELFQQLKKLDPHRAANIDKNNRRRLIRALEIVLTTKSPVPVLAIVCGSNNKTTNYDLLLMGIKKSPEELKKLIAARLKKRLRQGLIEEVKNLRNPPVGGGLNWKRLDDLGLEYRYVSRYLRGLITKQEMVESILKESQQYAKRQMTWFSANKGGFASGEKKDEQIRWIENEKGAYEAIKKFLLN